MRDTETGCVSSQYDLGAKAVAICATKTRSVCHVIAEAMLEAGEPGALARPETPSSGLKSARNLILRPWRRPVRSEDRGAASQSST